MAAVLKLNAQGLVVIQFYLSKFLTTTSASETPGVSRPLFRHWRAAEVASACAPRG